jgi:hypothetical protein
VQLVRTPSITSLFSINFPAQCQALLEKLKAKSPKFKANPNDEAPKATATQAALGSEVWGFSRALSFVIWVLTEHQPWRGQKNLKNNC